MHLFLFSCHTLNEIRWKISIKIKITVSRYEKEGPLCPLGGCSIFDVKQNSIFSLLNQEFGLQCYGLIRIWEWCKAAQRNVIWKLKKKNRHAKTMKKWYWPEHGFAYGSMLLSPYSHHFLRYWSIFYLLFRVSCKRMLTKLCIHCGSKMCG